MNEKGESWTIDLIHEPYSGRFYMKRGWTTFCAANGKKHGDLFTFKLVQNEETPALQLLPLNSDGLNKHEPSNNTRQGKCLEAKEKTSLLAYKRIVMKQSKETALKLTRKSIFLL
ncbi:unnamed protein product [Arabis nemorensis]|uniref:TF-B3 domain-containing protein n=1 Tax=Arabis nemorensis TaxID=586526 RepID=A0A565C985_9BRAS|nr:unnamed protein product [Arabis nemorensis]